MFEKPLTQNTPAQERKGSLRLWARRMRLVIPAALALIASTPHTVHGQDVIDPDTLSQGLRDPNIPGNRIINEHGHITTDDTHGRAGPRELRSDIPAEQLRESLRAMEPDLRRKLEQFKTSRQDDAAYIKRWKEDYTKLRKEGVIGSDSELREFYKYIDELYETLEKGYAKVESLLKNLNEKKSLFNENPKDPALRKEIERLLQEMYDIYNSMELLEFDFRAFDETEALQEIAPSEKPRAAKPEVPTS